MRSRTRFGLLAVGLVLLAGLLAVAIRFAVPRVRPISSPRGGIQAGHSRTLRNGKVIWVFYEGIITPGSRRVLTVYYRTHIDENDQEGWAREVQGIWPEYVPEAEREGLSEIVIWPTRPEAVFNGLGAVGIAGGFDVTKDASGKWTRALCDWLINAAASKPHV